MSKSESLGLLLQKVAKDQKLLACRFAVIIEKLSLAIGGLPMRKNLESLERLFLQI